MFHTPNRLMLGSPAVTYLSYIESLGDSVGTSNIAYWPLDDAFTGSAGTINEIFGNSDQTHDRGLGTYFTSQAAAIRPFVGDYSAEAYRASSSDGQIRLGYVNFADTTDCTIAFWYKTNNPQAAGYGGWNVGYDNITYTLNNIPKINPDLYQVDDSVGGRFSHIEFASPADDTNGVLVTWTQEKVGATWTYKLYLDANLIDTKAGYTQIFKNTPGALQEQLGGFFFNPVATSNTRTENQCWYQGALLMGTAEDGGGALTQTQISALYSLGQTGALP